MLPVFLLLKQKRNHEGLGVEKIEMGNGSAVWGGGTLSITKLRVGVRPPSDESSASCLREEGDNVS
jgi:hypothetical protein